MTEAQKEQRDRGVHKPKFAGYIFFDYEAYSNAEGFHVPNLVIAKRVCADCLDKETRCQECQQTHKFDTNEEFCEWLLQQEHYTALAHNLKGYDGVFIANYCIKHLTSAESFPELIATPTKLLQIKFRRVKIIDSYSFLPMGLDKFSKTFALQELKKGFFPHAFNKPENASYDDRYPDKSFYGSEFFSISKKAEFDEFYAANKDKMFNFQQELVDYCISDVNLLMEGCLRFRRIIIDSTKRNNEDSGVDPFRVAITMASLCNYIYRRNYMPQDTIAIIPDNGYNPRLMSSKKAQRWLDFQAAKEKVFIQTAANDGEKKVGNYQLDGFCEENKTIYEFNGCYWHGCQKCYSYSTWNSTRNMTMGHINNLTKTRREHITSKFPDHKFVEKWECEFDTEIATDMTIQKFIKLNPISEQLKPRDALFGGRTNAFLLYYKAKANEKIKYYDFTSLYPTVQKYELYPADHPEIITSNFGDYAPGKYFGLVKCSVLPPRRLYFPLLPARINKKLVFTLCSRCASTGHQGDCRHSRSERTLSGTWPTPELDYAVEHCGYRVEKIEEVWHWTEKRHLFTDYVNACMKEKQEASGFPAECETEEAKHQYIDDYRDREGIQLDYAKISKNSGARACAKLKANSQWGFMAMKTNKTRHKFVKTRDEFNQMLANDQFVVHNAVPCDNGQLLQVFYSVKDEMHFGGLSTNVSIAALVTSYARMRLYKVMEKLGDRLMYVDTDSIIFISREGQWEPELGNYLGEFTNEIDPSDGEYIVEACCAGPKNYSLKFNTGKTKSTVKGINLHHVASVTIDYESIKDVVCNDQSKQLHVKQLKFTRDNKKWLVWTSEIDKTYSFVYDKRVLKQDLSTLPYGF